MIFRTFANYQFLQGEVVTLCKTKLHLLTNQTIYLELPLKEPSKPWWNDGRFIIKTIIEIVFKFSTSLL